MSLLQVCRHPLGCTQPLHVIPVPDRIYITPGKTVLQSVLDPSGWKRPAEAMAFSTPQRLW